MSGRTFRVHSKKGDPFSVLLDSRLKDETLLFESGAVAELSEPEVEVLRREATFVKVADAYSCLGVLQVDRSFQYLVLVTSCVSAGKVLDSEIYRITGTTFISLSGNSSDDDKVSGVQKLFNSGAYYFAQSGSRQQYDLTLCAQRRLQDHATDNRFFWNRSMHILFERYDIPTSDWLVKCICGGLEIRTIYSGNKQAKACVISRLSCERAGTRFNTRGTNDDGHVANFVETEQVIFLDNIISSYVQIRGSVPLFWEQPGVNVGSHKVKISRGYEACAPALERHLDNLQKHYGKVSLVNLLGRKEGENMLSQMFQNHLKASPVCRDIPYKHFDYHSECPRGQTKKLDSLVHSLQNQFDEFSFFNYDGQQVTQQQRGCFRVNCVDCLDRTNAVQAYFAARVLYKQLELLGMADKPQLVSRFEMVYGPMWQSNGDSISKIYAGTGAMTVGKSKYRDVTTSATRAIQNNFLDSSKQDAINLLLLGSKKRSTLDDVAYTLQLTNTMHASTGLIERLIKRHPEYTTEVNLRVCLATWNVNGGTHYRSIAFRHESQLNAWLQDIYPNSLESATETCDINGDVNVCTDIFAVGFEEIVDLTAKNITSASTSNQKTWGSELEKTLSRDHKYILITSSQLVGVCLFVFVRPHLAPYIRDVSVASVKTGLGGAAGNKGAIAIRFRIYNSSLCFVCAHFAAGQSGVKERNDDFAELSNKISFPLGGTLKDHDYVFWVGDFNYRIDLPKAEAERLIKDGNWPDLLAADQLTKQRAEGNVFQGYEEGVINFAPTYKYDLFCDDYDTSEKARVPSWTDRCLWKRSKLSGTDEASWSPGRLLVYNRAELKTSDHRPVSALLDIPVLQVDSRLKEEILEKVVQEEGPTDGTVIVSNSDNSVISDESVEAIVDLLSAIGQIILVRFVENDLLLTFVSGQYAVEAVKAYDNYKVNTIPIKLKLKMTTWRDNVEHELKRDSCSQNTFYSPFTNDLLGDDFKHRSMSFDLPDVEDELLDVESENSLLGLTVSTSGLSLSPSPSTSGRTTPVNLLDEPAEPKASVPPPRPSKPPSRPPPPKKVMVPQDNIDLLTGSPSPEASAMMPDLLSSVTKPSCSTTAASSVMTISQPELIAHSTTPLQLEPAVSRPKPVAGGSTKRISSIGVPTNISHTGAKTEGDARKLIESLMMGQSVEQPDLPAPLLPAESSSNTSKAKTEPTRPPLPKSASLTSFTKQENTKSQQPDITLGLSALKLGSSTTSSVRVPPPIPTRQQPNLAQMQPPSTPTPEHLATTKESSADLNGVTINQERETKRPQPAIPPRHSVDKPTENGGNLQQAPTTAYNLTPPIPAQRQPPPIPSRNLPPTATEVTTNESSNTSDSTSHQELPPTDTTATTNRIPPAIPERKTLPPA